MRNKNQHNGKLMHIQTSLRFFYICLYDTPLNTDKNTPSVHACPRACKKQIQFILRKIFGSPGLADPERQCCNTIILNNFLLHEILQLGHKNIFN
jgi:hypothetical protein